MKAVASIIVAALCAAGLAYGANLNFLKDSPISRFTPDDIEMLKSTIDKALKEGQDGTAVDWKNDKTGAEGSVTPLKTYPSDGTTCKDLRIANSQSGLKGEGTYKYCQKPDKSWVSKGPTK